MATPVCEITLGGAATMRWLCARHQSDRRGSGWSVKPTDRIAPWPCDDCVAAEQAAPGYVTPTLAVLRTSPDARLPTRAECPPPAPIAPWPKPKTGRQRRIEKSEPENESEAA